jgi:cation diffusion facilitator CzcD-associated flavoprotein CzcO
MIKDSDQAAAATAAVRGYMEDMLEGDDRLCKAMIPDFPLGCRRLTPDVGYLASLRAANVDVVTDPIARVMPRGIKTEGGQDIELDAIVCATGFNVSFCPRFPIVGRAGNLQEIWTREVPRAYMSCAVPDFPNFFSKIPASSSPSS